MKFTLTPLVAVVGVAAVAMGDELQAEPAEARFRGDDLIFVGFCAVGLAGQQAIGTLVKPLEEQLRLYQQRLQQAGIRLAALLEHALREP